MRRAPVDGALGLAGSEPGDCVSFDNPSPYQLAGANAQIFAKDSWGGTFHDDFRPQPGDVVAHEHWGSSGFGNTDLDLQLKQHGIRHIILIGMIANTCIESTGRFGMELGYRGLPGSLRHENHLILAEGTSYFGPTAATRHRAESSSERVCRSALRCA